MRRFVLVAAWLVAGACADLRPHVTAPIEYSCRTTTLVVRGAQLELVSAAPAGQLAGAARTTHEGRGDHYGTAVANGTVDVFVPVDAQLDATASVYDGTRTLIDREICIARGGYTDVLARYLDGATFEDLARQLTLDSPEEARTLVRRAMMRVARRFYHAE
jgi:hypothetical protein